MNRPEEMLQRSVVTWLRAVCPEVLAWHVPNQRGTRKGWEQGLLTAMGLKKGVPDLCLVLPGGRAAFIELKAGRGRLRPEQTAFHAEIVKAGGVVAVCRTLDDVETALTGWGVALRGRIA